MHRPPAPQPRGVEPGLCEPMGSYRAITLDSDPVTQVPASYNAASQRRNRAALTP